jgi:predicted permease
MMIYSEIAVWSFNAIAPLLFVLALGWLIAFRGHIDEDSKAFLNRLCFTYLLPLQLFGNTLSIDFGTGYNGRLLVFCGAGIFITAVAAWIVFAFTVSDRARRAIFILSAFRTNNIIYGLPLAKNLFGAEGVAVATMVYPVTIVLFNILTVITLVYFSQNSGDKTSKVLKNTVVDILRNPLILACILGTLFSALRLNMPQFLKTSIESGGSIATPTALLLLGSQIDLKKLSGSMRSALAACAVRLIFVPAVAITVMVFAGFRGAELSALMVAFAAPSAVTNMVMARHYNTAPVFAAQTVYLSTIFSVVTIFSIIALLRALGLM